MPTIYELYEDVLRDSAFLKQNEIAVREILCHLQGFSEMSDFFTNKDVEIRDLPRFQSYLARFLNGEPVQYILNKARFLGVDYYVDSRVLIPRMETEEVVTYAINEIKRKFENKAISIVDLGTGSGIIAISMKKEFPNGQLIATDISQKAIEVAKNNALRHHVVIDFLEGRAIEPLVFAGKKVNVLISNPPYITNQSEIADSVLRFEPFNALVDVEEMGVYEAVFRTYHLIASFPFLMVFEIGHDMREKITPLLKKYFADGCWQILQDINKRDRILSIYIEKE